MNQKDIKLFQSIGRINKTSQNNDFKTKPSGLDERRLYRATGSKYDDISFKEIRKTKGTKKEDLLDWILTREGGEELLIEEIQKNSFEKYTQLSVAQIKEVLLSISGDFFPSEKTVKYMKELIGQCLTGQHKEYMTSKATQWGHEYEPEALRAYQEVLLKENQNLVFEDNKFVINKKFKMFGSTPDLLVYDATISIKKPIYVVENKCPYNTGNHIDNIDRAEIDPRYRKQNMGHLWNVPSAIELHFTSYDPRVKSKEYKLNIVRKKREDVYQEIAQLEKEMIQFESLYRKQCKKYKIDLDSLL